MMTPLFRKLVLTAHVTCSLGWFGAVASFLALGIAGLASHDASMVRGVYIAMDLVTWFVIVPSSFASVLTGIVQSLGTTWGLARHYWVLVKFLLTIFSTLLLLVHTQPIDHVAQVAADTTRSMHDVSRLRIQLVVDASLALLVLLVATTLSVYKPRGVIESGSRGQEAQG